MNRSDIGRTLALGAVSLAVAIGFLRVFDSPSFLAPLIATVVVAHLLAAATRRIRTGGATLIMVVAGALACVEFTQWPTTTYGVPTSSTLGAIGQNLHAARAVLHHASAPVAPSAGFLLVAAAALWVAAWSADRLAFGYAAPAEAIVPPGAVFVVVTLLTGSDFRWLSAGLFAIAVAIHALANRHLRLGAEGTTVTRATSWHGLSRGGAMAGVAILVGLGVAAAVPAVGSDAVVPLGPGSRDNDDLQIVNPLVDIHSTLAEQSDSVLFDVHAPRPAYWRLMALGEFDGTRWQPLNSSVSRVSAGDSLDETPVVSPPHATPMKATFSLSGLGGTFAPAPYRPTKLLAGPQTDRKLWWDPGQSGLIASTQSGGVAKMHYRVTAEVPDVTAADLNAARGHIPAELDKTFTELPADFPADLRRLAYSIVDDAHASTPFAKALALQNWFRDNFTYSLDFRDTDGRDPIHAFLEARRGFCEQFAGTYGAFARAVGLPTRVAVGFTWGDRDDDGTFVVRGRNAHAWPEVFFAGLGWLPFEPTPERGNPVAAQYTRVPAHQDEQGGQPTPPPTTVSNSTVPGPASTVPAPPTTTSRAVTSTTDHGVPPSKSSGLPVIGIVVALAVAAVVFAGPVCRRILRRRRLLAVKTPADAVRLAWADTLRAWRPLHFVRRSTDTDRDLGFRLARRITNLASAAEDAPTAHRMAELAGAAAWNGPAVTQADATEAAAAATRLGRIARDNRSWLSRLLGWFDPR